MWLKQSTAVTIKMGPFVDQTDGFTAETALTISQGEIRLSKNGGAYAQTNNAAGATHDEKGNYGVPLDTTDTNTLGTLRVHVHESGALPVWQDFMVVPANVWDSLFGTDKLQVHADEITNNLITAASIASDAITAAKIASDAITAAKIASNAITASKIATDAITASAIAAGAIDADALAADAANEIVDALLDRSAGVETGITPRQALRGILAALAGKLSGAGTTTVTIRNAIDTADRITATVDADGNRSAVTLNL